MFVHSSLSPAVLPFPSCSLSIASFVLLPTSSCPTPFRSSPSHLLSLTLQTWPAQFHLSLWELHKLNYSVYCVYFRVLNELVEGLRGEMALVYKLCENIAELDFIACLAQVSSTPDYTRPVFSPHTSLMGARHPILDYIKPTKPTPNNVVCLLISSLLTSRPSSDLSSVHLILFK